ncbi:hypothetical protein HPP92_025550 [Vanilla planifolia]|uniref:Uncharacterized protein n=1 Tax=Vanilla planifolia TaxID=51239 RepID=A0A835PKT3_VANPL|nr:hypothetical protein HPP92_025847 [Vanilla planifolia]KAG0454246.1 hypothetical protein HPP92_025550 [Vanilla planifolia]
MVILRSFKKYSTVAPFVAVTAKRAVAGWLVSVGERQVTVESGEEVWRNGNFGRGGRVGR